MHHRRLYDVTRPVRAGMPVWPGDAPCCIAWTARRDDGDAANVAELRLEEADASLVRAVLRSL